MPLGTRLKKFLHAKKMKKRARGTGGSNPSASIEPTPDQSAVVDDHEPNVVDCSSANTIPLKEAEKPDVKQLEPDNKSHSDDGRNNALAAIDAAINISLILRDASEASSVLIPLKISCTVLHAILQAAREKLVTHTNLESLIRRLEHHYAFIEEERRHLESNSLGEPPDEQLLTALEIYIKALEAGRAELTSPAGNAKKTGSYTATKAHVDPITVLEEEIEKGFRNLVRQVHNCILSATIKTSNGVAETRLSHLLRYSVDARGDRVKPLTLGTRLKIIQRLSAWGESSDTPERVFWLHDEAGTGKSSLAAHMAGHWEKEGVLLGRFFFNRNGGRDFRRLDKFCVSLVREMSDHHPLAKAKFLEILGTHSAADVPPFTEAFQTLISVAEELSKRLVKRLLFVIDALDECHEDDVQLLTASILNALPNCQGVRFLLTSRPTKEITAILDGISSVGGKDVVLLDVRHGDAERDHDTCIYVRHVLKGFSAADQNTVIQCASGVFLWATLACDTLLRTISPKRVLEKFQNNQPDQTMQILYEAALEAALPPEWSSNDMKLLHAVLQGVSLTYAPVSIVAIRSFFPKYQGKEVAGEEFVEFFVKKLGSIMKDGTPYLPIYILHPTFREFIEDQKNGARFYISPPEGHHSIAMASLALLTDCLIPNVLSLDDGVSPFPVCMPLYFEAPPRLSIHAEAPLRYSAAFWVTHASLGIGEEQDLQRHINAFFSSKLLVWIEWSSAIHEISECINGLRHLRQAIEVQNPSPVNDTTAKWCGDTLRFLLHNNHIIEECGLQAWMSALVFTPKHSLVYQHYSQSSLRPLPRLLTDYVNVASDGSRVLHDSKESYSIVSFSPDGKRILAFYKGSRLYNASSLKLIKELMTGPSNAPAGIASGNSVAFSSDATLIAGDWIGAISLWDGFTGEFKEKLPHGHKTDIIHVKFALSDSVVVAIDKSHQILCWSVAPKRAAYRARAMKGSMHTAIINAISSSSKHNLVATFSSDKTVRLWDPEIAVAAGIPMLGSDKVVTGLFSADGTKIIAGYWDGVVGIWDVDSQSLAHSLNSGSHPVYSFALSPNGRIMASGAACVTLWDLETGQNLSPPIEEAASCLTFNRSGTQLVSGSWKGDLKVWNVRTCGASLQIDGFPLKGHTTSISVVAASPSGRLIVSGCDGGTLRAWDTDSLEHSNVDEPSNRAHITVTQMAVSQDGVRLVTAGEECMFQVWDFVTGQKLGRSFESPEGEVKRLVFSYSNLLWASLHSSHSDGLVVCLLWQYQGDHHAPAAHTVRCEQGSITCVTFLPDNTQLLTGGDDMSIRIWDLPDHICVAKFDCTGVPRYTTISQDGRLLASISGDGVYLWDMKLHRLVAGPKSFEISPRSHAATFVSISPDGVTLATMRGGSLQLFDIQDTIRYIGSFTEYHIPLHWVPAFSLDGGYLFYGNYIFNMASVSRNSVHPVVLKQESAQGDFPPSPVSPLHVEGFLGHIYSTRWKDPLLVIPSDVRVIVWAAHEQTIAFGSKDGRVFIIHFPKEFI